MSDLRTLLRDAAHAAPVEPAATALDGDLTRGRRALAARRARWAAVPTGLVVVSAAAVLVPGSPFAPQPRPTVAGGAPASSSASAPASVPSTPGPAQTSIGASIHLVAYTGRQPAGYTIDKVPDGWEVQGINEYALVVAPVGFKDTNPDSFEGKITVSKANDDEVAVHRDGARPLRVGKATAKFFAFPEGDQVRGDHQRTLGLLLPVGKGNHLIFQIPGSLRWDAATVADFAAGVHMTGNAKAALG
jgi:hypothetical protein